MPDLMPGQTRGREDKAPTRTPTSLHLTTPECVGEIGVIASAFVGVCLFFGFVCLFD